MAEQEGVIKFSYEFEKRLASLGSALGNGDLAGSFCGLRVNWSGA